MPTEPRRGKRIKIILDSNALFVPFQFKIDIVEELKNLLKANFELIVLSPVMSELERLAKKEQTKMRKSASYALKLTEKCTIFEIDEEPRPSADDVIVKVSREWGCPVFTNDRHLRRRLRDINVPVIYVRQKSRLEINGRI